MILSAPIWLALLIPLGVMWLAWPLPTRLLRVLRAVTLVALVLAICHPSVRLPDRAGTVVVVADRSESMPANAAAAQKEAVALIQKAMSARDQLAVVSFGQTAAVERPPQQGEFAGFTADVGSDHSNLNEGLESALALIPPGSSGRVLILSDGKWTGRDPGLAAARAAGRGVPLDFRVLARAQVNDLSIAQFLTPETVLPGQSYMITAWVQSPVAQEIQYELTRGGTVLASGKRQVPAGLSRLLFRDRALQPGTTQYKLAVNGAGDDPIPENNTARALVGVRGPRPLLLVAEAGEESGLAKLLRKGGVNLVAHTPGESRWSLEELSQYSAVIIENVLANSIGVPGMESIASWVEETGSGLMLTGGRKSYGPGGYFKSPLDRVMPISMEMRREHRKMALAIVVALDRSGSMAAPIGGGKVKMDLADLGTVQVLDLLSGQDELGVIAVDSAPHTIVPLMNAEQARGERSRILAIQSMGGGIFIYEALAAASQMIIKARAETKHIILFADAADSEEPGRYKELMEHCQQAGITVSVVGLGTDKDVDADLLKDIARRGQGQIYFSNDPAEIPRLFAQDTFTVARSTFVDQATSFKLTGGFSTLGGLMTWQPPALGGYNLCYIRPEATLAAVTQDEFEAPAVAAWHAGTGRVLCYTGEADGKFAGAMAQWKDIGDFYATLARWTAGERTTLPDNMLLTQEVRDGVCFLQLHLDPERVGEPFAGLPRTKVLHGLPGAPPTKLTLPLQWKTADLLEAVIPIRGRETVLATVEIPGLDPVTLAPVCLPYSPEFAPETPNKGRGTLEKLAAATGGAERVELAEIWKTLPKNPRLVDLAPWLIVLALVCFLAEILQRRTGWLALQRKAAAIEKEEGIGRRAKELDGPKRKIVQKERVVAAPSSVATPSADPALNALRQARQRAKDRRGRE